MVTRAWRIARSPYTFETCVVIGSALVGSVMAAHFNAFERFCIWAHHFERFQADELLVTALIFCVAFFCLFLRRDHELRTHLTATEVARASAISAAHNDELTGLPNRRAFVEHAGLVQRRCAGFDVLILDLDGFKAVNDKWGHGTGDEVLCQVAARLKRLVEQFPGTYVARLGGDEFAAIVEQGSGPVAPETFARRIIDALAAPLPGDPSVPLGASVGIAANTVGATLSDLLHRADRAMYQAKQDGGACYRCAPREE